MLYTTMQCSFLQPQVLTTFDAYQHVCRLAGRGIDSSCRRKCKARSSERGFLCCLNYSNLVGQLELPGRDEKDEEDSEENRTGRIHLSGWRGELPRKQKNESCWEQGDGKQTFCKRLTLSETALENLKLLLQKITEPKAQGEASLKLIRSSAPPYASCSWGSPEQRSDQHSKKTNQKKQQVPAKPSS